MFMPLRGQHASGGENTTERKGIHVGAKQLHNKASAKFLTAPRLMISTTDMNNNTKLPLSDCIEHTKHNVRLFNAGQKG